MPSAELALEEEPPSLPEDPTPSPEAALAPSKLAALSEPAAAPSVSDRDLRQHWQRWTNVVHALVSGKRLSLDERDYRELHRTLLEACRERQQADNPQRALWQRAEQLLEPWLSVQTLGWADKATLDSLLACCEELQEQLKLEDNSLKGWHLALMGAILAAAAVLPWVLDRLPRLPAFSNPTFAASIRFLESHALLCTAVAAPLLLLLLVSLVLRVLR
jgi:hypothetical protein